MNSYIRDNWADAVVGMKHRWVRSIVSQVVKGNNVASLMAKRILLDSALNDELVYFPYLMCKDKSDKSIHEAFHQLQVGMVAGLMSNGSWIGNENAIFVPRRTGSHSHNMLANLYLLILSNRA